MRDEMGVGSKHGQRRETGKMGDDHDGQSFLISASVCHMGWSGLLSWLSSRKSCICTVRMLARDYLQVMFDE